MSFVLKAQQVARRDLSTAASMGVVTANPSAALALFPADARAGRIEDAAQHIVEVMPPTARAAGADAVMLLVVQSVVDQTKRQEAARALRELAQKHPINALDRGFGTLLMVLHAMVGDLESAFAAANHAADEYGKLGAVGTSWPGLWIPEMRSFRQDPRFQQLAVRLRLFDYWQVHGPPDNCSLVGERIACR